jgi:hypothetical protein
MDSFIEINDGLVIHFEDWIYDAIINRTLKEFEDKMLLDFVDFINYGRRETTGYLSLMDLDSASYKIFCRNIRKAYNKSQPRKTGLYSRKAHNQFLRDFKNLIYYLYKDDRFQG